MKQAFVVAVTASMALPSFGLAQTSPFSSPRGTRQPIAAHLRDTGVPVTSGDALMSGRSASARGTKSLKQTDVDTGPIDATPQICTNCDD